MMINLVANKTKFWTSENGLLFLLSIFGSLSLTMTFTEPANAFYTNALVLVLYNLSESLADKVVVSTLCTVAIYAFSCRRFDRILPCPKVMAFFSMMVGMVWLMGESYNVDNTLSHLYSSDGQIVKSVIYLIGITFILFETIAFLYKLITDFSLDIKYSAAEFLKERYIAVIFVSLLLFWAFPLIVSYPANMNWDAWHQLQQFWRFDPFDTHQPIMHTLIMGAFTLIGKVIGSSTFGLFLFALFQTVVYASIISYSFVLLRRLMAPNWIRCIYYICCALSPYYVNSISSVNKDCLYSMAFLLLMIEAIYAFIDLENYIAKKTHWVITMISIFGVLTLRSNGRHVLYPSFFAVIIYLIVKYRKTSRLIIINALIIMIAPIIAMLAFNMLFEASVSSVNKVSVVESLSLPFQQTARTIVEHGNDITNEEYLCIDKVLEYEKVADAYNPILSDPVKALYRNNSSKSDLKDYIYLWVRMFFKYPGSYVSAVFNQSYGLFFLNQENNTVCMDYLADGELAKKFEDKIGLREYMGFASQKEIILYWYMLIFSSPFIGLLCHPAIYIFILLVLLILSIYYKRTKCILLMIPLVLCIVSIILGPSFQGHPRYAFPIIYSMPIVLAYYIYSDRESKKTINE